VPGGPHRLDEKSHTHDCGRNGTVSLFAALGVASGPLPRVLKSKRVRNGAFLVLLVAVMLLGAVVRIAPHFNYYPIPGAYFAYSTYDIDYILRTGHEIRPNEVQPVTSYSSGIYIGTEDVLRNKLEASVLLLMGLDETSLETFYRLGLWMPVVVFPLMVLALYSALARANGIQTSATRALLLAAFAVVGSFYMLMVTYTGEANTATGWVFMLGALYGLLRIPVSPRGGRLMFFGFTLLVVFLYHTAAAVLASVLTNLLIFRSIERTDASNSHSSVTILTALVGIVAYFAYVSLSFFDLFAKTLGSVPSILEYLLRGQGAPPRDSALSDLLSTNTDPSFVLPLVASAILIVWPFLLVVGSGLVRSRYWPVAHSRQVIVPWLLGLGPFAVGLYLWSGVSGVMGKAGEFGSVFSIVATAYLFASLIGPITRRLLYLSIIAAMVLAVNLYMGYERNAPGYLTYAEQDAATWLAARAKPNEVVFTDLRLAAPLIVANHMAVVGIDDYQPPPTVRRWLSAVYYGNDAQAALSAMREVYIPLGTTLRYAMFSTRQSVDLPGIKGYDYNFKAAPSGFTDKFVAAAWAHVIYDAGGVRIFKLDLP
jgi:hypothetical protein